MLDRERHARRLKALAHPQRLAIVELLAARGTCICGELVGALPIAQATVSQHLKILKEAGFVRGTIDGPRSCYCLDPVVIDSFRTEIATWLARIAHAARHNPDLTEEPTVP